MCGIAGKINCGTDQVSKSSLFNMLSKIEHRGPETKGIYLNKNIGLCHSRLKIIDLSDKAKQPMSNENGSIWIVFNGEIYNYRKLRKGLIKKGHQFKSDSDTEVIIHLYEDYKEHCLEYLRGMFAFAIWDDNAKKLFIARDRLGQKPLKYYHTGNTFIFASELKAILANQEVKKGIDVKSIDNYLRLGYVPSPLTGFKNINKLPPAHYMIVENGEIKTEKYWKLDYSKKIVIPEEELVQVIKNKLTESVQLRMVSDVPLGLHLSGGIDSSAIAAIMAQLSSNPIKTFSIGFKDPRYSELPQAEYTAKILNTDHKKFTIHPEIIELLPKLSWYYEEPYADIAAAAYFYLSQQTKKYVTVALNGDGGDENFGGYSKYRHIIFTSKFNSLPAPARSFICRLLKMGSFLKPINTFSRIAGKDSLDIYIMLKNNFSQAALDSVYKKESEIQPLTDIEQSYRDIFYNSGSDDLLDRLTYLDFMTYLPDDLTAKVDIATMAFALEARSPMLDHEFVELCASVPAKYKIKKGKEKYIFRKSLEKILPKNILYRKKKAFILPYNEWFKTDLKEYTKAILLDKNAFILRNFFNKIPIEKLLDEHIADSRDHTFRIYSLLMLEHWGKTFNL